MNLLIDIGHPAHVHLFKNSILSLRNEGYSITVTAKNLPSITSLLKQYEIPYISLGKKPSKLRNKLLAQIKFDFLLWLIIIKKRITLGIGSSITLAHCSRFTRMKSIVFDDDDDEVEPLFVKYAHPFCDFLYSPDVLLNKRKRKDTIHYPSYHELAYLHPENFKPDPSVLEKAGLKQGERYFIMRFNMFLAHHDTDAVGMNTEQKVRLANLLSNHGKVLITTEGIIEPELKVFQYNLPPQYIHSLLYFADLFIGDSQTMTSESAVLGTPAIRCNNFTGKISYLDEQEFKYGLIYSFHPTQFDDLISTLQELIIKPDLNREWNKKRQNMLSDKINLSKLINHIIKDFPRVPEILKVPKTNT